MNNFKLESPYCMIGACLRVTEFSYLFPARLIFNAAGWAMGQVLSAARDACEQAPGKLNLKFVSDVISTSTVTIASIFLCCYRVCTTQMTFVLICRYK